MNSIPNISYPPLVTDKYGLTRDDHKWLNDFLFRHAMSKGLLNAAFYSMLKRKNKFEANQSVLNFHNRAVRKDLWLSMDDSRLRDWCEGKAKLCRRLVGSLAKTPLHKQKVICEMLNEYGIEYPLKKQPEVLADFCPFESANLRLADALWWRRQVRILCNRELEGYAREMGVVNAKNQIYCSDHTVEKRTAQKKRNRSLLSELEATNEFDESFTLDELADLSISNPYIKRSELMVRMRGFEEYAERMDYAAEFYTITCPSRFHTYRSIRNKHGHVVKVVENENYDGSSVREAHDYLVSVGCRIRAALHRRGIYIFGFRVAEPHHDGCPHWHYLVFCRNADIEHCRSIFRSQALAESPNEPGAQRYRFKAVSIDKDRGTATGYIAKYIAKNIDGDGVGADLYGHDAIESAGRIDAWASCHGIRQFQQIGGPSVSVWRELRRLDEQEPGQLETARLAADSSRWADYCALMGYGRSQPITLAYWQEIDPATGEVAPVVNKYQEPVLGRLFGVALTGLEAVCTRFYSWTVSRIDRAFKPWLSEFLGSGANAPPWSSVNNCTEPVATG